MPRGAGHIPAPVDDIPALADETSGVGSWIGNCSGGGLDGVGSIVVVILAGLPSPSFSRCDVGTKYTRCNRCNGNVRSRVNVTNRRPWAKATWRKPWLGIRRLRQAKTSPEGRTGEGGKVEDDNDELGHDGNDGVSEPRSGRAESTTLRGRAAGPSPCAAIRRPPLRVAVRRSPPMPRHAYLPTCVRERERERFRKRGSKMGDKMQICCHAGPPHKPVNPRLPAAVCLCVVLVGVRAGMSH
uniref:Uncharacterized protein n=1 Tax=Oryza glumipatula TaxID=40148 RepID=A0A0D9ZI50_9ORYZ